MPTMIGPAIAPTTGGPADLFIDSGSIVAPEPPFVPPGDPDIEWTGTPARGPSRCQVVIGQAVSGEAIGELVTAVVQDWSEDVELLAGAPATVSASSWDPLWAEVAQKSWVGADGTWKYQWDPRGFRVTIYLDGIRRWSGICREPVNIGGGDVALPAVDAAAQFAERILGFAEQPDLLGDRGSFEGYASVAEMVADGWVFPAGVTAALVSDAVRGVQSLAVQGKGWVRSPRVTVVGADGYGRAIDGSTFGRWPDAVPSGTEVVKTWAQRADSLVVSPSISAVTNANAGQRPDDSSWWTEDPVASGTRMTPQAVPHRAWVEVRSFNSGWSYYDLITERSPTSTGFPPGTDRDYAYYIERIHRDLVARSAGGSPTGLTTRIVNLTGNTPPQALRWAHSARSSLRDILSQVLDADGGPECRITPAWVLEITDRLGDDRDDISITVHDVVGEPKWTTDPGARVDDYVADTGRGSGATRLLSTISQPIDDTHHRILAIAPAPDAMSLNSVNEWAKAHARAAARIHVTAEVPVSMDLGEQLATGDTVRVALEDGASGHSERMRVVRRRWLPQEALISLSLGATDG